MNASSYAVASVGASALIVSGAQIAQGKLPGARIIIGATVAAVMLSAAAGVAPGVVRALSTLIIVSTVLGAGYALIQPLVSLTS